MKFKSELAQEAISIILKDAKDRCHLFNPKEWVKFHNAALARAIEVAAKIELEERRLEQEEMKIWISAGLKDPQECKHHWFNRVDGWYCMLCGIRKAEDSQSECLHSTYPKDHLLNSALGFRCKKCGLVLNTEWVDGV